MIVQRVQDGLTLAVVALTTTTIVGIVANTFRLELADAILLGNAVAALVGLAIGRWRSAKERTMGRWHEERWRFPSRSRAHLVITIDDRGVGQIDLPGQVGAKPFDRLFIDLTGDMPKIAIINRPSGDSEPPVVA